MYIPHCGRLGDALAGSDIFPFRLLRKRKRRFHKRTGNENWYFGCDGETFGVRDGDSKAIEILGKSTKEGLTRRVFRPPT